MLILDTAQAFSQHIGETLGPTDWRSISQTEITGFADMTGDDHWIHVDIERAAKDNPGGRTIVHGLYVLSLVPKWQRQLFHIEQRGAGLLYGYDKVRFVSPIMVDTPIRLSQVVGDIAPHKIGTRISLKSVIEVQSPDQVALVAESILLIADA